MLSIVAKRSEQNESGRLLRLLAGYMAEATYHHLLLLLGVAFLSGAVRAGLPRRRPPSPSAVDS
jgi:hypothetical protein